MAGKEKKSFWDVFIISEKGEWRGVRTPKHILQRTVLFVAFLVLVSSLAILGVFLGRWKISNLQNDLAKVTLDYKNLTFKYNDELDANNESSDEILSKYSVLPKLNAEDYSVSWLEIAELQFKYDHGTKKCDVMYRLSKKSLEDASKGIFYSVVLLQSPSGLLSHPPVFNQKINSVEIMDFLKGSVIRKFNRRINLRDSFKLEGFVDNKNLAPIHASLLIYDDKGNLLHQSKKELTVTNTEGI